MNNHPGFLAFSSLVIFLLFIQLNIRAQDQNKADSLINIYETGIDSYSELELLNAISKSSVVPDIKLKYSQILIEKASKDTIRNFLKSGYLQKGNALQSLGRNIEALKAYFESLKNAKYIDDLEGVGSLSVAIAGHYSMMEDFENASTYFQKGIQFLRNNGDSISLASALLNAGDNYINSGRLDSALIYTREAQVIFHDINYSLGEAYSSGNLGIIHAEKDQDSLALEKINIAIKILENRKDYYPISVYLTYVSDIYAKKRTWDQAFLYANRSLELARKYGLKEQISEAHLQLSELYEKQGIQGKSFKNYKQYIVYRDSVTNIKTVQEMANLRTDYEVSQKQTEIDLKDAEVGLLNEKQRNQRVTIIATVLGLGLLMMLALGLFRRNRLIQKSSNLIQGERDRSDELLLNILPEQTAKELKDKGKVQAKRFESVTVMFTDFKGFTAYSDKLSPEELVDSIDFYYSKFDDIIEKHGLEKIKTVGDAYMCAGGLPFPSPDHSIKMVKAAIEIAEFVNESKKMDPDNMTRFDMRIGINTGPVVAGVVGKKKFAYDIWGDTVNIASRMESNSEPGQINISDNTYQLIKDQFKCTYRGEVEVKNKGMMKMYFVKGIV